MPDPDDEYQPGVTVGELRDRMEGEHFETSHPDRRYFECDWCSKGVPYQSNPRVGHYIADDVLNPHHRLAPSIHENRPIIPMASYCDECTTRMLLFPCRGFAEARLYFEVEEDRVIRNVEVRDVSPREDGIPWNPREVSEKITGIPYDMNSMLTGDDHLWGPENIVTFFLAVTDGIDIRELVRYDGSLDPKLLGQARKSYEKFQQELGDHGRKSFRDQVRD